MAAPSRSLEGALSGFMAFLFRRVRASTTRFKPWHDQGHVWVKSKAVMSDTILILVFDICLLWWSGFEYIFMHSRVLPCARVRTLVPAPRRPVA
jgi:hypothetical protein